MTSENQLDQLIGQILLAEERGEPVDREALLSDHPLLADELRAFLAHHDVLRPNTHHSSATDNRSTGKAMDSILIPGSAAMDNREFADYELEEELGRGGMGIVYRARQKSLGKTVALKMLLPGALHDPSAVKRFYTEAEAAARLEHPGIVPVYNVGEYQGKHYYSMALIEGHTLAQLFAQGPLSPQKAAELIRQAALAVHHAHQHGVIHRDIKPANILIDDSGEPKITDFGLAKKTDDSLELTVTGQIIGTLAYMAPEQAAGRKEQVTTSVDVYALGAVLYTAISGQPPFSGESHAELLIKVLTQESLVPQSPHGRCTDLVRICQRCLEKDPQFRYPSAQALAEDLDRFLHHEPVNASVANWTHRCKKWVRRQPSLAAHLLGLGSVEFVRQTTHWWLKGTWTQNLHISSLILFWAALCLMLQWLIHRTGESARFLWPIVDLILITSLLTLVDDPYGPLLVAYPLSIVFCGLLFRVRLIVFMTLGAVLGYLTLLVLRPATNPPHYHLLFVLMLVLFGTIIGTHLRRLRLLNQIYHRRLNDEK